MKRMIVLWLLTPLLSFSQTNLKLDTNTSYLYWEGNYIIGGGHHGSVQLISGHLLMKDERIAGGSFTISMNSIKNTDDGDENSRRDLEDHLKSADFFDVARFPTGYFAISSATFLQSEKGSDKYKIAGQLSLKGISNNISFPGSVMWQDGKLVAEGEAVIDRTQWDIVYNSKSLMTGLKDGVINDLVKVKMRLIFNVLK